MLGKQDAVFLLKLMVLAYACSVEAFMLSNKGFVPTKGMAIQAPRRSVSPVRGTKVAMDSNALSPPGMPTLDGSNIKFDLKNGRRIVWEADAAGTKDVLEGKRSMQDYIALPPSEYSVLDAGLIERLNDKDFRMQMEGLNFFGNTIQPVLYVTVDVDKPGRKSTLTVTGCELKGSAAAEATNGTFNVESVTVVSYKDKSKIVKKLKTDVFVKITAVLPENVRLPFGIVERIGNFIVGNSLKLVTNRFVSILAKDYGKWSQGLNDSRAPVAEGNEKV
mmetsp:Transcript_15511/g.22825  ORF Transcript_15511/g.22825 Transcript_15511/m.22825 type:complete len:276 (-) Transcript_15511:167-994(-)|eukprot:CAMPEP_0113944130 /NCGR_PEP_ID=MMETSP1339-20121228/30654_1 /TAXON_ID=94617 /ORGANISM="Fibrocapsa japonica" /LENGTH=275 /DNA_ID=CAMNT_0000949207 /DNA_START=107 /DNA_END=934 /DNA_ORIENTATION=- /assembly_acc=CAM_ASM_000762